MILLGKKMRATKRLQSVTSRCFNFSQPAYKVQVVRRSARQAGAQHLDLQRGQQAAEGRCSMAALDVTQIKQMMHLQCLLCTSPLNMGCMIVDLP